MSNKILIIGEAWGKEEEKAGRAFVGLSGQELDRMLAEAGISRATDVVTTNLFNMRPPHNNIKHFFLSTKEAKEQGLPATYGLHLKPEYAYYLEALHQKIADNTFETIIVCGNYPLWALAPDTTSISNDKGYKVPAGIARWRGSMLSFYSATGPADSSSPVKLMPIYHPAAILRQWAWRKITVHDLKRVVKYRGKDWPLPDYTFILQPSFETVVDWLRWELSHIGNSLSLVHISLDLETYGGHIACIGLAISRTEAICIPFINKDGHYWSEGEEWIVTTLLRQILTHPNFRAIGQNLLFDLQYIHRDWLCIPKVSDDTMIKHHVAFPGTPKGLDYLSSMYCRYHTYWKDEGKHWNPKTTDLETLWAYNCKDAVITWEVNQALQGVLDSLHLGSVYAFQMQLFPAVLRMMMRGCHIDKTMRGQLAMELMDTMLEYEQWFAAIINDDFWPAKKTPWYRSPTQQKEIFYEVLKLPVVRDPKNEYRPTVRDEALEKLKRKEPLLIGLFTHLQEYRSLGVFLSTFVQAPLDDDLRMRCSFNITGTETFRFSSSANPFGSGTNLQNIPTGDEE